MLIKQAKISQTLKLKESSVGLIKSDSELVQTEI